MISVLMAHLLQLGAGVVVSYLALPVLSWVARRDPTADPQSRQAPLVLAFAGALTLLLLPVLWPLPASVAASVLPPLDVWPNPLLRVTPLGAPGQFYTPLGLLGAAWLLALLFSVLRLCMGALRLHRIARQGEPFPEALQRRVEALCAELMIRAPHTRISGEVAVPLVVPGLRPTVLLPAHLLGALDGPRLELALRHELTHLARGDHRVAIAVALLRLPFVLHPSAPRLERELAIAREEAVDARVSRGAEATYAELLLEVTRLRPSQRTLLTVPAMSDAALVRRVKTLLDGRPRPLARWVPVLAVLGVALCFGLATRPGARTWSALPPVLKVGAASQRVIAVRGLTAVTVADRGVASAMLVANGALLFGRRPGTTELRLSHGDGTVTTHALEVTASAAQ